MRERTKKRENFFNYKTGKRHGVKMNVYIVFDITIPVCSASRRRRSTDEITTALTKLCLDFPLASQKESSQKEAFCIK